MHLSIIIPAYNEERCLPAALAAAALGCAMLADRQERAEIIVVDNNSTDRTAEIARQSGALVVSEPVNQIGRARNAGARAAQGKWLLFLDADSQPSRALWEDLAAALADPKILGGGATLQQDGAYFLYGLALKLWNAWSRLSKDAAGAFLFFRREAFEAVGGFDLKYYAGEEVYLCRRIKRYGRSQGLRCIILSAHPLLTSARKAALYTPGEFGRFLVKTFFHLGRTLHRPADCGIWYDGRR